MTPETATARPRAEGGFDELGKATFEIIDAAGKIPELLRLSLLQ
jgi:hypothetical protein